MAEEEERFVVELALEIQADIFTDLAAGLALIERYAAFQMIYSLEEAVARDLAARATEFHERGLSITGIGQVASFLADTFSEAKEKMVRVAKPMRERRSPDATPLIGVEIKKTGRSTRKGGLRGARTRQIRQAI